MLRVKHNTDELEIWFDHRFCGSREIEAVTGICVDEERRCSIATVSINGKEVGRGMAVCNPMDNFCRAMGRKKALASAMYPLTRQSRSAVWHEYEAVCGF